MLIVEPLLRVSALSMEYGKQVRLQICSEEIRGARIVTGGDIKNRGLGFLRWVPLKMRRRNPLSLYIF